VNKIAAANVMHQIAELLTAEWIVAKILNHGAAIGVGVSFFELIVRKSGIFLKKKRLDFVSP